jgi:hypothetical protein
MRFAIRGFVPLRMTFSDRNFNVRTPRASRNVYALLSAAECRTWCDFDRFPDHTICLTSPHYSKHCVWVRKRTRQGTAPCATNPRKRNGCATVEVVLDTVGSYPCCCCHRWCEESHHLLLNSRSDRGESLSVDASAAHQRRTSSSWLTHHKLEWHVIQNQHHLDDSVQRRPQQRTKLVVARKAQWHHKLRPSGAT